MFIVKGLFLILVLVSVVHAKNIPNSGPVVLTTYAKVASFGRQNATVNEARSSGQSFFTQSSDAKVRSGQNLKNKVTYYTVKPSRIGHDRLEVLPAKGEVQDRYNPKPYFDYAPIPPQKPKAGKITQSDKPTVVYGTPFDSFPTFPNSDSPKTSQVDAKPSNYGSKSPVYTPPFDSKPPDDFDSKPPGDFGSKPSDDFDSKPPSDYDKPPSSYDPKPDSYNSQFDSYNPSPTQPTDTKNPHPLYPPLNYKPSDSMASPPEPPEPPKSIYDSYSGPLSPTYMAGGNSGKPDMENSDMGGTPDMGGNPNMGDSPDMGDDPNMGDGGQDMDNHGMGKYPGYPYAPPEMDHPPKQSDMYGPPMPVPHHPHGSNHDDVSDMGPPIIQTVRPPGPVHHGYHHHHHHDQTPPSDDTDMMPPQAPPEGYGKLPEYVETEPKEHGYHYPDDHYFDHHHIYHEVTTTTTEAPEERVNKGQYSYYYLGRKLWYVPLYFSVYFIIYVTILILKSIARHKVTFWQDLRDKVRTSRNLDLDDLTKNVTSSIDHVQKKYMMK